MREHVKQWREDAAYLLTAAGRCVTVPCCTPHVSQLLGRAHSAGCLRGLSPGVQACSLFPCIAFLSCFLGPAQASETPPARRLATAAEGVNRQDAEQLAALQTDRADGDELCTRCRKWGADVKVSRVRRVQAAQGPA